VANFKFAIRYNYDDAERFLAWFEPYMDRVDHFFFTVRGIRNKENTDSQIRWALRNLDKIADFIKVCKQHKYRTFLVADAIYTPTILSQLKFDLIEQIRPFVNMGLTGVCVASYTYARILHDAYPQLKIQKANNLPVITNRTYHIWNNDFKTDVFGLPPEALRTPSIISNFAKTGYIPMCVVDDTSAYGAPGNIEEECSEQILQQSIIRYKKNKTYRMVDLFQSNVVPPNLLNKTLFDDYNGDVIFKINAKCNNTAKVFELFSSYMNGENVDNLMDFLPLHNENTLAKNHIVIKSEYWPKKTMTCECNDCDNCNDCNNAVQQIMDSQNLGFAVRKRIS